MRVKRHHPAQEAVAKELHGIECVPIPEVRKTVNRAAKMAKEI